MEKKQTAVEWLVNHITEDQIIKAKSMYEWLEIFEQAKQMEKEQIVEAGRYYFHERGKLTPQQYYNEQYGK